MSFLRTVKTTLDPENDPNGYDIARQQQIANMLQQQAAEPIATNQGPISWTQGLAKMLQAYSARKVGDKISSEKQQMAQNMADALQNYQKAVTPRGPNEAGPLTPAYDPTPQDIEAARSKLISSVPGGTQAAIAAMIQQSMTPDKMQVVGKSLVNERTGRPVYSEPAQKKIKWIDAGDKQIATDEETGQPIAGMVPVPVGISPNTRYTQNHEDQRAAAAREAALTGATKPPSGFQWNKDRSALEAIPGGPSDPGGVGQGSRAELMFNRIVTSANEAALGLKNITELPVTASTGWFGTAQPGTGLMSSAKSVLSQKMNPQEVQDTKVMLAGITRSLATIETSGLAPNSGLMHSLEAVTIGEGDTHMTKLRKMAEIRQIVERGLEVNLENPKIPPQQKELVKNIIKQVQDAVPYTHHDITQLQQAKNPQATISDYSTTLGLPKSSSENGPPSIKSDADYAALPSGAEFIAPDGSHRKKP